MRRDTYTELPKEHPASVDGETCGKLVMTLPGARDAGENFEFLTRDLSFEFGAKQGVSSLCLYFHEALRTSYLHHGDDFTLAGPCSINRTLVDKFSQRLLVKTRAELGPSAADDKAVTILHRLVCWKMADGHEPERIEWSADLRHGGILIQQAGLTTNSRNVTTPMVMIPITNENLVQIAYTQIEGYRSASMKAFVAGFGRPFEHSKST